MAVAAWAASTSYSLGNIRRSTTAIATGLFFKVTVAGTSASAQPSWPTDIGSTVIDGGVTWIAISSVYEDVSLLAPNTIIELFEMHLDNNLHGSSDIYRWHNGCNDAVSGNITWNSQTYSRQPIAADGFDYQSGEGTLPRPKLTVSNLDGTMTTLLILVNATTPGNDLGGAEVIRIRCLKKHLDGEAAADPNAQFPQERYLVDRKTSENRESVSFELASRLDLPGYMIPKRQLIGNICQWAYRSGECGYTGSNYWNANDQSVTALAEDKCGKRLGSCKLRFGGSGGNDPLPYGSFPTAGRTN